MDSTMLYTAITQVSELSDEATSLLMHHTKSRELKKGEAILKEGEVCRAFYFVENGYLRTYYNKDGVVINLNFTFEGQFTANLKSIKSRKGSEYTIEAGEDTKLWIFNLDGIPDKIKSSSPVNIFIRRLAIRLLLASEEHSNLFKMYTPIERYRYLEKNNPALLQRISLSQIASYIGVARETLSRLRSKK
jgi:CRP-like cAMP-binding protein